MDTKQAFEEIMKYREGLIKYGKRVAMENPDRLKPSELEALVEKILIELNNVDLSLGYPNYDMGIRNTHGVGKERVHELFIDFLDWYEIIPTPSNTLLTYIKEKYPVQKFRRILCVGDGECSHLGRKLARLGYDVVSVDPLARKEFTIKSDGRKQGKLHIVQGMFLRKSTDMINWANLIVGAKVTEFAEELIELKTRTVFNISNNAEMYDMTLNGTRITSSKVLENEIKKCAGVSTICIDRFGDGKNTMKIFECEPTQPKKEPQVHEIY